MTKSARAGASPQARSLRLQRAEGDVGCLSQAAEAAAAVGAVQVAAALCCAFAAGAVASSHGEAAQAGEQQQ